MSMPRLTRTGLAPSPMARTPSWTIAWAMTVAVVVPSPTMSLVLIAASLTSCAPMFSNWSFRWISRAIVTPSLVTTGDPVIFSRIALRPLGPSVDLTASANWSTPASSRARASAPKRSSLAIGPPGCGESVTSEGGVRRAGLGDEDRPAADPAGVQVGDGLGGGVQRVGPGVQSHPAGLRQHHELGEIVVGPDDVADDVALGGDDVQRRDAEFAAVADDVVRAGPGRHREPLLLRSLLGHEVHHDIGATPAGQLHDRVHLPAVGDHGVVRAELLGELERVGVTVHHDDLGGSECRQALDADMTEPAGADHHARSAGVKQRDGLTNRVVGSDAGVGESRDVGRLGLRVELHAGPGRGEQKIGHPAVAVGEAGEGTVLAVHVISAPAGTAQAAARRRVQDHRVAHRHVGDPGTHFLHPSGVLVTEDVWQYGLRSLGPLALDDVQVGAAYPGAADLNDHVERALDDRLGHFLDHGVAMVFMQADGFHCSSSPSPDVSYLWRSMPRQMLPFASMLMRADLARRRCSGAACSRIGSPVAGSMSSGAPGSAGRPSSARRCRSRSSAPDAGASPKVIASRLPRLAPAASNGRHT